jgi:hypothetical protein
MMPPSGESVFGPTVTSAMQFQLSALSFDTMSMRAGFCRPRSRPAVIVVSSLVTGAVASSGQSVAGRAQR